MTGKELLNYLNSLGENLKYVNVDLKETDYRTWKLFQGQLTIMLPQ
jgi:hypothetical protein